MTAYRHLVKSQRMLNFMMKTKYNMMMALLQLITIQRYTMDTFETMNSFMISFKLMMTMALFRYELIVHTILF